MFRHATMMSWIALGLGLARPLPVWAHIGLEYPSGLGHPSGLGAGFLHPLGGLDHLLAMFAVGFWAAQLGGRAVGVIPGAFLVVMLAGFGLGMVGTPLPLVEQAILASVVIMGLLIAAAWKLPLVVSCLIVGLFAICHGHAHGTEMPLALNGWAYAGGFAASTLLLHVAGLGLGLVVRAVALEPVGRFAGAAMVLAGVYLVLV